jgi:uncharacterized protein YhfF
VVIFVTICTATWYDDDEIMEDEMGVALVYMGEKRDTCRVSVRKFEGKEPLGRSRHKWEDVKTDVKYMGMNGVDWVNLSFDSFNISF